MLHWHCQDEDDTPRMRNSKLIKIEINEEHLAEMDPIAHATIPTS